jgi:hypothetical protein
MYEKAYSMANYMAKSMVNYMADYMVKSMANLPYNYAYDFLNDGTWVKKRNIIENAISHLKKLMRHFMNKERVFCNHV